MRIYLNGGGYESSYHRDYLFLNQLVPNKRLIGGRKNMGKLMYNLLHIPIATQVRIDSPWTIYNTDEERIIRNKLN